jgi:hypothetical protein
MDRVQVYVIVRLDLFFDDEQERISVQAVLPAIDEARREVERLNTSVDPAQSVYFMRASRF